MSPHCEAITSASASFDPADFPSIPPDSEITFTDTRVDSEHRLTKPNHPCTNGQVERMNRTIKETTVKRFPYESHNQLRTRLADLMATYNFARRLNTLSGLTPYEYIAKI